MLYVFNGDISVDFSHVVPGIVPLSQSKADAILEEAE
jgi:hypothetical protein